MPQRRRSPARDDLFQLFPDLPRPRRRDIAAQRARILNLVATARARVAENIRRQLEASRRVRETIAVRQPGSIWRRRSTIS